MKTHEQILNTEVKTRHTLCGSLIDYDLENNLPESITPFTIDGRPYMVLLGLFKCHMNMISAIIANSEGLEDKERRDRQIEIMNLLKNEFFQNQGKTPYEQQQNKE